MGVAHHSGRVLAVGRNCWKTPSCPRLAMLVDGKSYFDALAESLRKAEKRIVILGWDFDSRIRLQPDRDTGGQLSLGEFLRRLVEEREDLHLHVAVWRNSIFYGRGAGALMSALLSIGETWWSHPRIDFRLDDHHPVGGCHHQKIVAIDDKLAFVGGIDLTQRRWDDTRHAGDNHVRRTVSGDPHPPTHDVQLMVDGEAARTVAELAAFRWHCLTGKTLSPMETANDPWPSSVRPDLRDHPVGVSRTLPPYNGRPGVHEIATLNLDMLARARRTIYLEQQYFALPEVAELLARQLAEPAGPEIVLVCNGGSRGIMERYVMTENRDRMLALLNKADRFRRLRALYPVAGDDQANRIKVHSKVIVVDDLLFRVGSANLNSRSIGLDTECDLVMEATTPAAREVVVKARNTLLAEHLGTTEARFAEEVAQTDSLIGAIDRLNGRSRRHLRPFPGDNGNISTEPMPGSGLLDPPQPITWRYIWHWLNS